MAIYTNLKAKELNKHGLWESSLVKATDIGRNYNALVQDSDGKNIDVDNGVAITIGDFTHNGLEEVEAKIAKKGDEIAVVGAPVIIKDAFTKSQDAAYNFYIPAGTLAKSYQIVYTDIFGVAAYQFTDASAANIKEGNYAVVDGNGAWVAMTTEPDADTYGFIGKIHSIVPDMLNATSIVRIRCEKNEAIKAKKGA